MGVNHARDAVSVRSSVFRGPPCVVAAFVVARLLGLRRRRRWRSGSGGAAAAARRARPARRGHGRRRGHDRRRRDGRRRGHDRDGGRHRWRRHDRRRRHDRQRRRDGRRRRDGKRGTRRRGADGNRGRDRRGRQPRARPDDAAPPARPEPPDAAARPAAGRPARARRTTVTWTTRTLSTQHFAEGADVGDINGDGVLDLVAGPNWYAGPSFALGGTVIANPPTFTMNQYSKFFLTFVDDVNGDGRPDVIAIGDAGGANDTGNPNAHLVPEPRTVRPRPALDQARDLSSGLVANESPGWVNVAGDAKKELLFIWCRRPRPTARARAAGSATPDPARSHRGVDLHAGRRIVQHGLGPRARGRRRRRRRPARRARADGLVATERRRHVDPPRLRVLDWQHHGPLQQLGWLADVRVRRRRRRRSRRRQRAGRASIRPRLVRAPGSRQRDDAAPHTRSSRPRPAPATSASCTRRLSPTSTATACRTSSPASATTRTRRPTPIRAPPMRR